MCVWFQDNFFDVNVGQRARQMMAGIGTCAQAWPRAGPRVEAGTKRLAPLGPAAGPAKAGTKDRAKARAGMGASASRGRDQGRGQARDWDSSWAQPKARASPSTV